MSKTLTQQYQELCQVYGDLVYKSNQLQNQINDVQKKLEGLNLAAAFAPQPNPAQMQKDQVDKLAEFVKQRESSGAKVELVEKSPLV